MTSAERERESDLQGSLVFTPSGKAGRIVVVSVLLDLALIEVLDDDFQPTGANALLKTLAGVRKATIQ